MLSQDVYQDFLLAKELQGVSQTTLDRYHYSIERLLADLRDPEIGAVTTADVRRWLMAKTYRQISRGIDIKNLKTFFRWVLTEGYRDDNPMDRIPMPKVPEVQPKALSDDEVQRLIKTARKSPRDLAVVLVLLDTAIRASELAGIERDDIDLDRGIVTIKRGKGGKARQVYLSPITGRAVRRYLNSRKDSDPALFLSQRHEPLNRNSLRLLMYRLCDRAGIERHGPHSLRHTAATSLARQGCDAWSLQQILGHTDNRVSLRYIWLTSKDVQEAHRRFSPVGRLRLVA
jgi:integrase/recombinase XerD